MEKRSKREEGGEGLNFVDTSMGIKIVQVDPMLADTALARPRRQQVWDQTADSSSAVPPSPFWERARDMFYSSVLTTPELEALREGDVPIPVSSGASGVMSPVGENLAGPTTGNSELGEEKKFSRHMREEWQRFLGEEILLLRIERANETLDKESSHASMRRTVSTPGKPPATPSLAWATSPWSRSPQMPRSFTVPVAIEEANEPGMARVVELAVKHSLSDSAVTPKQSAAKTPAKSPAKSPGSGAKLWWQNSSPEETAPAQTPSSLPWLKWSVGNASDHPTAPSPSMDAKSPPPVAPTVVAVPAIAKTADKPPAPIASSGGSRNWRLLIDTFGLISTPSTPAPESARPDSSPPAANPPLPVPSDSTDPPTVLSSSPPKVSPLEIPSSDEAKEITKSEPSLPPFHPNVPLSPSPSFREPPSVSPIQTTPSPLPAPTTNEPYVPPLRLSAASPPPTNNNAPYVPPIRSNRSPSPLRTDSKPADDPSLPPRTPTPPRQLFSQKPHSGQLPPLRRTSSLESSKSLSGPLASQNMDGPRRTRLTRWKSSDLNKALDSIPATDEASDPVVPPPLQTARPLGRPTGAALLAALKPDRLSIPGDDSAAPGHPQPHTPSIISPPLGAADGVISPVSPSGGIQESGLKKLSGKKSMTRTASGVRAAMKAAEAAATGSKRMRKVWEKMKVIVAHKHQEGENGPSTPLKLEGSTLSTALRQGEIPAEQRGTAWMAVACANPEEDLLPRSRYAQLLKQESRWSREIERDVNRTFPLHPKFREERGKGQMALFDVIKAYSIMDPEIGYCQGMAFVAAVLLMHMEEAEDAFCCFVYLLYRGGLRTVFSPSMEQLQVRLYQLSQLLLQSLPLLHAHLEDLEIKPVMYAADWFLTLFARNMPLYIVNRVFDIIIAEKTSAIVFKLAIVLLQVCRRQLLQCPEMEFVMHFLRTELPSQLEALPDADLEELVAKALRVDLPFESLLRLEAEYDLLQEEVAMAARQVQAAAAASEAAATAWENRRSDLEKRLLSALEGQRAAEAMVADLQQQVHQLRQSLANTGASTAASDASAATLGTSVESVSSAADTGPEAAKLPDKDTGRAPITGQHERNLARWGAHVKTGPGSTVTTQSLLRTVSELRKEKAAVTEALLTAERALRTQIHLENKSHYSGELEMIAEGHLVGDEAKTATGRRLVDNFRSQSEAGRGAPRPKDMIDPLLRSAFSSVDSLASSTM